MKNKIHIATYHEPSKAFAKALPEFPHNVVIRLGGTLAYNDYPIQVNSAEAIMNSINKLKQKNLLLKAGLLTQPLTTIEAGFPVVLKGTVRSCGTSVKVAEKLAEYEAFIKEKNWRNGEYYVEEYFPYTSEYRLHCTQEECFFTVKKIKTDNGSIYTSKNHYNVRDFVKPRLWEQIKTECVAAMKAIKLDIGAVDVGYNSQGEKHVFTIHEINTNPEMLNNTFNAYLPILEKLINNKIKNLNK